VRVLNNIGRMISSTKSPIVYLSSSINSGIVGIRAAKKEEYFSKRIEETINENMGYFPVSFGLEGGYRFWVDLMNTCIMRVPAIIYILFQFKSQGKLSDNEI
jgi:hypothetical protein